MLNVDRMTFGDESLARQILDFLKKAILDDGFVTVETVYEICEEAEEPEPQDNEIGWTNLDSATIEESRGFWDLVLPEPQVLTHLKY